jgi:hypothetical protein
VKLREVEIRRLYARKVIRCQGGLCIQESKVTAEEALRKEMEVK